MATHKPETRPGVDVRVLLAARYRRLAQQYPFPEAPYRAQADRIEAGETVEVYGWELPHALTGRFGPDARLRIDPDGSLTVVEPERGPTA